MLKSHFGMGVLLKICCTFSEHLFIEQLWRAASVECNCISSTIKSLVFVLLRDRHHKFSDDFRDNTS